MLLLEPYSGLLTLCVTLVVFSIIAPRPVRQPQSPSSSSWMTLPPPPPAPPLYTLGSPPPPQLGPPSHPTPFLCSLAYSIIAAAAAQQQQQQQPPRPPTRHMQPQQPKEEQSLPVTSDLNIFVYATYCRRWAIERARASRG